MNVRAALLTAPVAALLLAASAQASSVSIAPLNSAPKQVAALDTTGCASSSTPPQIADPNVVYPSVAEAVGSEGVAIMGVSLSPAGRVMRAWPIRSTGSALLDNAALASARTTGYVAERDGCGPIGGDYQVEVEFSLDR